MSTGKRPRIVDTERFEAVELDDEIFLLDRDIGNTFRMNRTGAVVWRHLTCGSPISAALVELQQMHPHDEVDRVRIAADVDQFLDALRAAGALLGDA